MAGLAAELVANSNSQILVFSANTFSNVTPNGSAARITAGGFISPGVFGSGTYIPSINVNIYVGANGTNADPLVSSFTIPSFDNLTDNGPAGSFAFDTLVTLRANNKNGATAANGVYSGLVLSPFALQVAQGANGNVNSSFSGGGTNVANISVYAVGGPSQNASLVFEHCLITLLT
jgi:hypothetical protein